MPSFSLSFRSQYVLYILYIFLYSIFATLTIASFNLLSFVFSLDQPAPSLSKAEPVSSSSKSRRKLDPVEPEVNSGAPEVNTGAPEVNTGAPEVNTGAPEMNTGAPETSTVQRSSSRRRRQEKSSDNGTRNVAALR